MTLLVSDPAIWSFLFFVVFFAFGYESDKSSGGFFMLFSGFALMACGVLLSGVLIYINTMTIPFGLFIVLLGIMKAFFVVKETEEKNSQGKTVRRRRMRRR